MFDCVGLVTVCNKAYFCCVAGIVCMIIVCYETEKWLCVMYVVCILPLHVYAINVLHTTVHLCCLYIVVLMSCPA